MIFHAKLLGLPLLPPAASRDHGVNVVQIGDVFKFLVSAAQQGFCQAKGLLEFWDLRICHGTPTLGATSQPMALLGTFPHIIYILQKRQELLSSSAGATVGWANNWINFLRK